MTIFVDTNIPIHYQPLDQINWKEVTGSDDLTLIFSVIVFDELDKHTRNPRLAIRAKKIRKDIYNFITSGVVKDRIKAQSIDKPNIKKVEELGLDSSQNDQWILATVKLHAQSHPKEDISILTADFGMKVRAESLNISTIILDDKYEIKEENEEQKENRKLKEELAKIRNATPKLNVLFNDGETFIEHELQAADFDKYKSAEMAKLKSQYPLVFEGDGYSYQDYQNHSKQDAVVYNGQLKTFYDQYAHYLDEGKDLYFENALTIPLDFVLSNSGSLLANDIDLELSFPKSVGVSFLTPENRIVEPNRPYPPILGHLRPQVWSRDSYHNQYNGLKKEEDPLASKITETTEHLAVDFHIKSLKQQKAIELKTIYVTFKSYEEVKGLKIESSIRASNVPDVVISILNVKIKTT